MKTINSEKLSALAALAAALLVVPGAAAADRVTLNGAGGSFPAPLYQAWTYAYTQAGLGAKVNYQSVGSSAGINQIKAGTVDFAGTDAPLTETEAKFAGLDQFPMTTGAVVPVVNLPGVKPGALKLDGQVLADLFQGKITRWNDPAIAALNPGLALPDLAVTIVHRGDGSGTTYVFSSYLAKSSADWKAKLGAGAEIKWPTGLAGQKNPGVCNAVARVKGAIGYTEYTYALEAKLAMVQLKDEKGAFVAADTAAWPILGRTYILVRKDTPAVKLANLRAYLRWCFDEGNATAARLHYIPLPSDEVAKIKEQYLR